MIEKRDLTIQDKPSGLTVGWLALIIIAAVIIADQALKIWVKTSFYLGESYPITSWF